MTAVFPAATSDDVDAHRRRCAASKRRYLWACVVAAVVAVALLIPGLLGVIAFALPKP
jgi:hypothetical protein